MFLCGRRLRGGKLEQLDREPDERFRGCIVSRSAICEHAVYRPLQEGEKKGEDVYDADNSEDIRHKTGNEWEAKHLEYAGVEVAR